MRTRNIGELCERLRKQPRVLGARSSQTLESYFTGYATALAYHRVGQLVDETGGQFQDWARRSIALTIEHQSRLNAMNAISPASLALLESEDEHGAFERWIDLRMRCLDDLGTTSLPRPVSALPGTQSLFGMLATIRKRPGMYFWDERVEHCWALINGYVESESDHGVSSEDTVKMHSFQSWVDERYPFGRGRDWFRVFRLLAINPSRGCSVFFKELDLFLAGEPPDAPDPAMTTMIDAVLDKSRRG